MIPNFTLKGQGQSLTKVQMSGQVKVGYVAYHSIRSDETDILVPFLFIYHTWFKRYREKHILPSAYNGSRYKNGLTWGHENEKSEIYVLYVSVPVSYPESVKSVGLKLCSQRDLELWCRCRGDVPTFTWPGDLTFIPRRSKFARKMCYLILGRYA